MSVYLTREVGFNCIKTKESVINKEINYTQIKKTVNTKNIPGICVLTNHIETL